MNYEKPTLIKSPLCSKEEVANLTQWLSEKNLSEAGITTYHVTS